MTHPVANEVAVSVEQIEKYLLEWAKPGVNGQRKIHIRVLPDAGSQVLFFPTGREITKADQSAHISPELRFGSDLTEREKLVHARLTEYQDRFRIGMKLTAVVANFMDGRLMGFEWETAG
jgi:hypothetical protein